MKRALLLTGILAITGCGATPTQAKNKSVCTVRPEECQKQIKPLTPDEIAQWTVAKREYDDAEKKRQVAADRLNGVIDTLSQQHHLSTLSVFPNKEMGTKGSILGGTCMGRIEIAENRYLLYTPAEDIQRCVIGD